MNGEEVIDQEGGLEDEIRYYNYITQFLCKVISFNHRALQRDVELLFSCHVKRPSSQRGVIPYWGHKLCRVGHHNYSLCVNTVVLGLKSRKRLLQSPPIHEGHLRFVRELQYIRCQSQYGGL